MSTLKLGWGGRIAVLYGGFVILIVALVTGAMRQDFDLVADDYYQQEIAYQNVLDAGKNQSALTTAVLVSADEKVVNIEFPADFNGQQISGKVHFYSPINSKWDKQWSMKNIQNNIIISRNELRNTTYVVKINWEADNKKYYQESEITLQ